MNRIHRSVWNAARGCFVAAHEKAASRGRSRGTLARCVALALLGLAGAPASAATVVIDSSSRTDVGIPNGDSIWVTTNGSAGGGILEPAVGPAAVWNLGPTIGSVTNHGVISSVKYIQEPVYGGLALTDVVASGGITNSGTISAGAYAVKVAGSTIAGSIVNSAASARNGLPALLSGAQGLIVQSSTVHGDILNAGFIRLTASTTGILIDASVLDGRLINSWQILGGGIEVRASSVAGEVINSGLLSSGGLVIDAGSSLSSGLVNSDFIHGPNGVEVGTGSEVRGGFSNSGSISSDRGGAGVLIASGGAIIGGLTDSGTISGTAYAIDVAAQGALDAIDLQAGAVLNGDVEAAQTPLTLSSGATLSPSNAIDVETFSIEPGARLNMGTMPSSTQLQSGITGAVSNAGTLAIADGVSAQIHGSYAQSSSGALQIGASSADSHGALSASGTVVLPANAVIDIVQGNAADFADSTEMLGVIEAGTLSASTFSVRTNSRDYAFTAAVDPSGRWLDIAVKQVVFPLAPDGFQGGAAEQGAAALFNVLMAQGSGGLAGVLGALEAQASPVQLAADVAQTLPAQSATLPPWLMSAEWLWCDAVAQRLSPLGLRGGAAGDGLVSDAQLWFKPFASRANQSNAGGLPGFAAQTAGFELGADGMASARARIGLGLAFADSGVSGAVAPDNARVDMLRLLGYGSDDLGGQRQLTWQVDAGTNSTSAQRGIAFMGQTASASYTSMAAHADIGIGRDYTLSPATSLEPSLHADYVWLRDPAYGESGAGALDLNVHAQTTQQLVVAARGGLSQKLDPDTSLRADFGTGYDVLARQRVVTAAFAGDPTASFVTLVPRPDPWVQTLSLGVTHQTAKGVELSASLEAEHRVGFNDRSASLKARWPF